MRASALLALLVAAPLALGVAAASSVRIAWTDADLPAVGAAPATRDGGLAFQALAMVGREDRIAAARTGAARACVVADGDAITAIAERARDAQIVIVNEAHDSPRDRAFIADLVTALAPLGYQTYAAETLTGEAGGLQSVGPDLDDGYFSGEPAYGALLRTAKDLGYRFLPYAQTIASTGDQLRDVNAREEAQARTLTAWFARNPAAKVIIHVGYSHNREITERVEGVGRIQWMAERLAAKTKINPLTIDQTTFTAERTGVCATTEGGGAMPLDRDIHVAQPALTFQRGRPTWRLAEGQRFADVPRALRSADDRVIVEARRNEDPVNAVPVDRVMIDPGETMPLLLPIGRYKARAWIDGEWTEEAVVNVREATTQPVVARQKATQKSRRKKR